MFIKNTFDKEEKVRELLEKVYKDSICWNIDLPRLEKKKSISLGFLNAHAITIAYKNDAFSSALMNCDYLLRDGIGIKIALYFFGYRKTENLNGTDLIPEIIKKFCNKEVAIWGSLGETVEKCKDKLSTKNAGKIISTEHGFHRPEYYIEKAEKIRPDIILLCMGMPKQEMLAKNLAAGNLCEIVICGGGWADFYSQTKKRAPYLVRKLSLEWLHRLIKEPKRLGYRYTIGIVRFFYIIIKSKIKIWASYNT